MIFPRVWTDLTRTSYQLSMMTLEAQAVIWMRLWGMGGFWNVAPGENRRMVSEKLTAATKAQQAATRALLSGKSPVDAALKPIRRKTASNLSRLSQRGPKLR